LKYRIIIALSISLSLAMATDTTMVIPKILEIGEQVRQQFCPDRRVSVWSFEVVNDDSLYVIKGETDQREAVPVLKAKLSAALPDEKIDLKILVLPDDTMNGQDFGIIINSVESLRSRPSVFADLLTQTLRGLTVEILKWDDDCYYVRTDDGYLGWIDDDRVVVGGDSLKTVWAQTEKVVFDDIEGVIYAKATKKSLPVADVVLGNRLKSAGRGGRWTAVELADGRKGFIPTRQLVTETEYLARKPSAEKVIATARSLLGRPYMWGATSPKALDCSGLTQTAYRRDGLVLLRDASMQANQGQPVDLTDFPNHLQPGDLLFFGSKPERITHTGIYIGDWQFIHCSGRVRINSFREGDDNFSAYLLKRLQKVQRVIPE